MTKDKTNQSPKKVIKVKQKRRKWIAFVRMCRYGINNFTRNAWLTIAATAVMTITLLIVFISVASRSILLDTVSALRDKVDMSIYVNTTTPDDKANIITEELYKLSSVKSVSYVSAAKANELIAEENRNDLQYLEALKEANNKNPGVFHVIVKDINDTSELSSFVDTSEALKPYLDPNREPSFAGERKASIENIGHAIGFAEQAGIIAGSVFVFISSLIIFNTIRMAIFNRKEEIQMMKLIGADQSFIRGPFVVEAMVYGFFAAVVASGIGYALLLSSADTLTSYQITIQPTIDFATYYAGLVLLAMIIVGAFIGIISSLFATRRYLKI
jgi:cell division transport system permease protein